MAGRVRADRHASRHREGLNTEIVKILNMPDVQEKLLDLGAEPVANSSEEFQAFVKTEVVKWGDVVKKSGAKVD